MKSLGAVLLAVVVAVLLVAFYTRFLGGRIASARVTSWWRSPFHNTDVGGLLGSLHIIGWAVDLAPDSDDVAQAARDAGFPVVVREGDHVHAAWWRA